MKKKTLNWTAVSTLAIAAVVSACAGGTPEAEAPAAETSEAPAPEEAPEEAAPEESAKEEASAKSFDDMTPPERMKHMKEVVTPAMAKTFKELDEEEFSDFSCKTCHGPGAAKGDFEMPSGSLPLDQEEMEEHPEVTKFMMERIVPQMAELLGEEPFNPETKEGFGCYHCHTKEEH